MEQMLAVAKSLRLEHKFQGYIHLKAIPGASPELVEAAGFFARPHERKFRASHCGRPEKAGPGKTREKILTPMRQVQKGIVKQIAQEGLLEKKGTVVCPSF